MVADHQPLGAAAEIPWDRTAGRGTEYAPDARLMTEAEDARGVEGVAPIGVAPEGLARCDVRHARDGGGIGHPSGQPSTAVHRGDQLDAA